ncbi:MAG TPA: DUF3098 domain-containing protein [Saprospiraceae bacterium]|nr:DUF3098 domain-containing protein [Saprospiraceae bacterium]
MSKQKKVTIQQSQPELKPTESKITNQQTSTPSQSVKTESEELVFGRKNYYWIVGGFLTMLVGYLLMTGGSMPSPDVWDESLIYSFRRITLAPFVILLGIAFQVVGIFSRK